MKTISDFKIARFEFKVTEHYGLWAKCIQPRTKAIKIIKMGKWPIFSFRTKKNAHKSIYLNLFKEYYFCTIQNGSHVTTFPSIKLNTSHWFIAPNTKCFTMQLHSFIQLKGRLTQNHHTDLYNRSLYRHIATHLHTSKLSLHP